MTSVVIPPGWPSGVRPAHTRHWELSAEAWLLDLCPPEYRGYPVLRRHLVVLARFAVRHVEAMQEGCTKSLSAARAELRGVVASDVAERAVETWLTEEARLRALRREVGLVESALRGTEFRVSL